MIVLDFLQKIQALAVGKFLVQGDEVYRLTVEHVDCGLGGFRGLDVKEWTEDNFQRIAGSGLIVDDQNCGLPRGRLRYGRDCHMAIMYSNVEILSSKTYSFSASYASNF
jgi:hypothetical protein